MMWDEEGEREKSGEGEWKKNKWDGDERKE